MSKRIRKRVNPNHGRNKEILSDLGKFFIAMIMTVLSFVAILWFSKHDKTNVEANKIWAKELKDFEANMDFFRSHPNAEPLGE